MQSCKHINTMCMCFLVSGAWYQCSRREQPTHRVCSAVCLPTLSFSALFLAKNAICCNVTCWLSLISDLVTFYAARSRLKLLSLFFYYSAKSTGFFFGSAIYNSFIEPIFKQNLQILSWFSSLKCQLSIFFCWFQTISWTLLFLKD